MFTFGKKDAEMLHKKSGLIENEALKKAVVNNAQNEAGGLGDFLQFLSFGQFGQFGSFGRVIYWEIEAV